MSSNDMQVTDAERADVTRWITAKIKGEQERPEYVAELAVLSSQWGQPRLNTHPYGHKLKVSGRTMSDGLYCHANCRLAVLLPGRARRLTALCGVESNRETSPGGGNVVFAVSAGGKEYFRSAVQHEGMPVVTVDVALEGQELIILETGDGGLGISYCQGVWGEAVVTLEDGSSFRVGSLTLRSALPRGAFEAGDPFSFQYGGQPSGALLKNWGREVTTSRIDDRRTRHLLKWVDPATLMSVRCEGVEYHDFPVVEWTTYLRNDGVRDTPLIESLQGLDAKFERDGDGEEFVLHHHCGSPNSPADYEPRQQRLAADSTFTLAAGGGRGSNANWPYFNLARGTDGVMIVVGWPGQWATTFTRDHDRGLAITAGQELTRFVLHPGEEVRTPLMALLFWRGDRIRSHNLWRRWMLAHNVPRDNEGQLPATQLLACATVLFPKLIGTQEEEIACINRYREEQIPLQWWWIDAGWFHNEGWWPYVQDWDVDRKRYPGGIRAVSDYVHAAGMKMVLWFEPERVFEHNWLATQHPEWNLGTGQFRLLDLGNKEAWDWLVNHVDRVLTEEGIDLYRQDFNTDPLGYWRENDAPDRQGMTEMRYIQGYLAFWDELRRRHPGMLIDSCAAGGKRNDLETMRRAIPLWRTDYNYEEPVGTHAITQGISMWLPYHGGGVNQTDTYRFRSSMTPWFNCLFDVRRRDIDYDLIRRQISQWREVADFFLADFYPLLPYSRGSDDWMAWQFHSPEKGAGMIQAFRHSESVFIHAVIPLKGLDSAAQYEVKDLETGQIQIAAGSDLLKKGLPVIIQEQPGSVLMSYRKTE